MAAAPLILCLCDIPVCDGRVVTDAAALERALIEEWSVGLVVAELARLTPALLARLQASGAPPVVLVVGRAESADGVVVAPNVHYAGDAAELARAIDAALAAPPPGQVGDFSDRDSARLNALGSEIERIARALSDLATESREAPVDIDARFVRAILKRRRDRERFFPAELFSDPAWDMLLDLTAARLERRQVSVSSLCIAAAVPTTTALRWIRNLCDLGMFERHVDPDDLRRGIITLGDATAKRMLDYLMAIRGAGAPTI